MQSEYFFKNKPGMIPVILRKKGIDLPELKNCKYKSYDFRFLINENSEMFGELAAMRAYIVKNSLNKLGK
jgi:hypothetical protein